MSIVTLKKKVQSRYNIENVNSHQGFSLNGTRRSQGYVGQTMLSRSLPRTLCKGAVPRGHGGCCGSFKITPIVQSGVNYLNDSSIIKKSVMNTIGLLETQKMCNYNCNTVPGVVKKPSDCNVNLSINSMRDINEKLENRNKHCGFKYIKCNTMDVGHPLKTKYLKQTEYIESIKKRCENNNFKFLPRNTQGTPFGC